MEKHLLLLMVAFAACCAVPHDMSGKVFVFPKVTNTDHVKLLTSQTTFSALTTCLRFITDLSRNYALFSLSTSAHDNSFLLFKESTADILDMFVNNAKSSFLALSLPPNNWYSLCSTWTSVTGVSQLFIDGKPTIKRFVQSGQNISGPPITILGQEQDKYGSGFDASQSFIGMISQVHTWNYVLSESEIHRYVNDAQFTPGNVFNWRALDFQISGHILVEEEPKLNQ